MADRETQSTENVVEDTPGEGEQVDDEETPPQSILSRLVGTMFLALRWFVAVPAFLIVGVGLGFGIGIPYYDKFGAGIYEKTVTLAGWTGAALIVAIVLYLLLRYLVIRIAKSALGKSAAEISTAFREPLARFIGKHLGEDWERAFHESGDNGFSFVKRVATLAFSILGAAGMLATIVGLFVALISLFALSVAQEELVASRWSNFLLCEQNSLIRTQGSSKFRPEKPILLRDTHGDVQQLVESHRKLSTFVDACVNQTCVLTKEKLVALESIRQRLTTISRNWRKSSPSQAGLVSRDEERGVMVRVDYMLYFVDYIKLAHIGNLPSDKMNSLLASNSGDFRNVISKIDLYFYMVEQGIGDSCGKRTVSSDTLPSSEASRSLYNCRLKVARERGPEYIHSYLKHTLQKTNGSASKWLKLEEVYPRATQVSDKCEGWWLWCDFLEDGVYERSNIDWSRFTKRLDNEVLKLDELVAFHDPLCSNLLTEQQQQQLKGLKREPKKLK